MNLIVLLQAGNAPTSFFSYVIFMALIFILFYLFLIRQQSKKAKEAKIKNESTSVVSKQIQPKNKLTVGQVLLFILFVVIGTYLGRNFGTSFETSSSDGQTTPTTQQENNYNANTESEETTTVCSICGRKFSGSGYEEVSEGRWESTKYPHMSSICSPSCGMKHTAEINNLIDKVEESTGAKCSACGMGKYVNGYCNYCGAASQTTVNRHQDNYPVCNLCHGTGIEKPMGANSMGETGRVCPMCDGTGKDFNQSKKNNQSKNTENTINYKEIKEEIEQNMLKNKNVDKKIKEAIKKLQENRNSK